MTRIFIAAVLAGWVAGCTDMPSGMPAIVARVATDASAGLAAYQAALGAAEQAEVTNPATEARITAVAAKAAPYVADAQKAVAQAGTASSLAVFSAELLLDAAPHITVVPNGQ